MFGEAVKLTWCGEVAGRSLWRARRDPATTAVSALSQLQLCDQELQAHHEQYTLGVTLFACFRPRSGPPRQLLHPPPSLIIGLTSIFCSLIRPLIRVCDILGSCCDEVRLEKVLIIKEKDSFKEMFQKTMF